MNKQNTNFISMMRSDRDTDEQDKTIKKLKS